MKLYNSITQTIEELRPVTPPVVTIYTCGPTVYDYPHVGNWFTFVRYDTLIRTLQINNYQPKWVMNITDVGHLVSDADEGEDKLENGAKREGKSAWDVAQFYGDYFISALARLRISQPSYLPKATDHIEEQITLIKKLETKGFTYVIDDGVYFDTRQFKDYGKFPQIDLDELQAGARIEHNQQKRNITDFALWKFSPKDQKRDMEWQSPWGVGYPGWHIECSAMCMKYLGETIDIHAGGIDHLPVHHTNEIAQSEAATGKTFAHYWMHVNHVSINGNKISKSLGNSITLEDIIDKGFNLEAFRIHILESHYRSQSKFSWDSIESSQNRLLNIQAIADLRYQTTKKTKQYVPDYFDKIEVLITNAMNNDLNTPEALKILSGLVNDVEMSGLHPNDAPAFIAFFGFIRQLFGLDFLASKDLDKIDYDLIIERESARSDNKWSHSDDIRNTLLQKGIAIRDTSDGPIWLRTRS